MVKCVFELLVWCLEHEGERSERVEAIAEGGAMVGREPRPPPTSRTVVAPTECGERGKGTWSVHRMICGQGNELGQRSASPVV